MKKILFVAVMCLFAVMFSGCGGAKTPKDVAEKSIKCLKNKDYKGYVELVSLKDEAKMSSEELKKSREQMAVFFVRYFVIFNRFIGNISFNNV